MCVLAYVLGLGPCVFAYKLYVAVDFVASAGMPQAAGWKPVELENQRTREPEDHSVCLEFVAPSGTSGLFRPSASICCLSIP